MASDRKICVGVITGAHGVRGLVRIRSFTEEPEDMTSYGDLTDESGNRAFGVNLQNAAKDYFIAAIEGVTTREAAEELHGTELYADRDKLPKTAKQQYYEGDLIGLAAQDKSGKSCGKIMAIHDHGGGTFLEIGNNRRDSFMLPFTDAYVPEINLDKRIAVIEPPDGWLDPAKPGKDEEEEAHA